MEFDLEVTESQDELESFLGEATSPVVIWGHTGVGKSPIVSRIIKRLGSVEHQLGYSAAQLLGDGRFHLSSEVEQMAKSQATSFVWEWANHEEDASRLKRFYDSVVPHLNGSSRKLIMLAHPPTEELGHKLLGPILQRVTKEAHRGKLPKYISSVFPEYIMKESNHIAILPCAETWFDHTDCRKDGVVFRFINSLFGEKKTNAYKALYSFLFGDDFDHTMNKLSTRSWESLQHYTDSFGTLVFQGRFQDFDREDVLNAQDWILRDFGFNDGSIRGLEQVVAVLEDDEGFQSMKDLEMERLLSLQIFSLNGMGEYRERFESYEKEFCQST